MVTRNESSGSQNSKRGLPQRVILATEGWVYGFCLPTQKPEGPLIAYQRRQANCTLSTGKMENLGSGKASHLPKDIGNSTWRINAVARTRNSTSLLALRNRAKKTSFPTLSQALL